MPPRLRHQPPSLHAGSLIGYPTITLRVRSMCGVSLVLSARGGRSPARQGVSGWIAGHPAARGDRSPGTNSCLVYFGAYPKLSPDALHVMCLRADCVTICYHTSLRASGETYDCFTKMVSRSQSGAQYAQDSAIIPYMLHGGRDAHLARLRRHHVVQTRPRHLAMHAQHITCASTGTSSFALLRRRVWKMARSFYDALEMCIRCFCSIVDIWSLTLLNRWCTMRQPIGTVEQCRSLSLQYLSNIAGSLIRRIIAVRCEMSWLASREMMPPDSSVRSWTW